MKNILIILFTFLLNTNIVHAQLRPITVKLKDYSLSVNTNFTCAGIIDKRIVKNNIGYARVGMNKSKTIALLDGDFTETIHKHINGMIRPSNNPEQIFIVFHELDIKEDYESLSRVGLCKVEIEFVQQIDTSYYSLGFYSSITEKFGLNITKYHGTAISKCLQQCIHDFVQSNWLRNARRTKIDINTPAPSYDYTSIPPKGRYESFTSLIKNEPFNNKEFTLSSNMISDVERFKIKEEEIRHASVNVGYISDGTYLYINASNYSRGNYFLRAKQTGRYIYFEDRLSHQGVSKEISATFGLIGAAIGAAATNKLRGIVLDTSNGEISLLEDYHMLYLLKDYPEIKKSYEKSKRKRREREGALLSLNNKFRD